MEVTNLGHIFAKPETIRGIKEDCPILIHPIKLKDYDQFNEVSSVLHISRNHFADNNFLLLDLVFLFAEQLQIPQKDLINNLEIMFTLLTREQVKYVPYEGEINFLVGDNNIINGENYDQVRAIAMRQNLIFEQKVYKNKKVQEWANKALIAKSKNSSNISIEDIITTVSVYKGVSYSTIEESSLYQLYADFYRIRKMKKYDADIIFRSVSDSVTIEDFAESLDLFHNPYDDLFVSKDKLTKLNQAMGE